MSAWRKYFTTWMMVAILGGCTKSQRYVGLERQELGLKSEIQWCSGGVVRNGYSVESIGIKGNLHVATFKLVGTNWENQKDVLVLLEPVSESLKEFNGSRQ